MMGMIADFPVRDFPVMIFIVLGKNGSTLGEKVPKRGHKTIDLIQKIIVKNKGEA